MHFQEVIGEYSKHGEPQRQKEGKQREYGEERKIVKQTEKQEWKTDCTDKNKYYKPRGTVEKHQIINKEVRR